MYGGLEWSSLLSSSKTMATTGRCGGRPAVGTQSAAMEETSEEEEGEGNGAAGLELVRSDQVGEQQRTGSS